MKQQKTAVREQAIRVSSFARALRRETRSRFFQGDRTTLTVGEAIQIARDLAALTKVRARCPHGAEH